MIHKNHDDSLNKLLKNQKYVECIDMELKKR